MILNSPLFRHTILFCLIILCSTGFAQLDKQLSEQLNKRFNEIPLPDTSDFYGQNEDFIALVEASFCSAAADKNMRLGSDGWLYNLKDDLDFGVSASVEQEGALPKSELVLWLREYRTALEAVGITPIMMITPQRGLVSEQYLDDELKNYLAEIDSKGQYEQMRSDYLEAGFEYTPDLLTLTLDAAAEGGYHAYYPIDHHITTHTALAWAKAIADIVMSQDEYADYDITEYNISLLDKVFDVKGWHQQMEVQWACDTNMEGELLNPYYELEIQSSDTSSALFAENTPIIATVGSSHLGSSENRAGTSDYETPGSGLAEFTAYLTQLPVLNHPMFSLANASIEHYLRRDFYAESPPPYLVQLIEAHHHPYPIYHYRSMAPMTYGKCQSPIWQGELLFDDYFELANLNIELLGNSMDYYLFMELDLTVLEHREWSIDIGYNSDYGSSEESILFDTDDRFLPFPSTFGIQLKQGFEGLSKIQINPDAKWYRGDIITTSLCYIPDVQEEYKAKN